MHNKPLRNIFLLLLLLFSFINSLCLLQGSWLDAKKINHQVLMGANGLFFILAAVSIFLYNRAALNINPNVFVRTIMAVAFIKLMVIAFATLIYFLSAGESKSVFAVITALGLYVLYTIIEVKGAFRINKAGNGQG